MPGGALFGAPFLLPIRTLNLRGGAVQIRSGSPRHREYDHAVFRDAGSGNLRRSTKPRGDAPCARPLSVCYSSLAIRNSDFSPCSRRKVQAARPDRETNSLSAVRDASSESPQEHPRRNYSLRAARVQAISAGAPKVNRTNTFFKDLCGFFFCFYGEKEEKTEVL